MQLLLLGTSGQAFTASWSQDTIPVLLLFTQKSVLSINGPSVQNTPKTAHTQHQSKMFSLQCSPWVPLTKRTISPPNIKAVEVPKDVGLHLGLLASTHVSHIPLTTQELQDNTLLLALSHQTVEEEFSGQGTRPDTGLGQPRGECESRWGILPHSGIKHT